MTNDIEGLFEYPVDSWGYEFLKNILNLVLLC